MIPNGTETDINALNKKLVDRINSRPDIFITASEVRAKPEKVDAEGKPVNTYFLRVVVGGRSQEEHIRAASKTVYESALEVLKEVGIEVPK